MSSDVKYKSKSGAIPDTIPDEHVRGGVAADLELLDPLDATIRRLERYIEVAHSLARKHAASAIFGPGGDGHPHGRTFGDWRLAVARNDHNYLEKHYDSRFAEGLPNH